MISFGGRDFSSIGSEHKFEEQFVPNTCRLVVMLGHLPRFAMGMVCRVVCGPGFHGHFTYFNKILSIYFVVGGKERTKI